MNTSSTRQSAFTLVEIMIVVAIVGMLAAIAIPNFVKARQTAQTNACINNLRTLDSAKQQWLLENKKESSYTPTEAEVITLLKSGALPVCPAGGSYTINSGDEAPTCSIPRHSLGF